MQLNIFFVEPNRNRIIEKRINVRIEHVKHSNSRLDFLNRIKRIELLKKDAKTKNIRLEKTQLKREVTFIETMAEKTKFFMRFSV